MVPGAGLPALKPRATKGRCWPRSGFPRQIFKSKAEGPAPPLAPPTNRGPGAGSLIGWESLPWKLRRCCPRTAGPAARGLGLGEGQLAGRRGKCAVRGACGAWENTWAPYSVNATFHAGGPTSWRELATRIASTLHFASVEKSLLKILIVRRSLNAQSTVEA